MSESQLFDPKTWQKIARSFAREMYIPAPVVIFTLIDGSSFKVRSLEVVPSFVLLEVYDEDGEIALRLVPWANIRDIEIKKDTPEVMERLGISYNPRVEQGLHITSAFAVCA